MSASLAPGYQAVQRYELNMRGRDFVVGDLHGAFGLLRQAMAAVGYDPERDRLFSVGDLIDRGPDSADVVDVLQIPGFHAIAGNHELMLLDAVEVLGIDSDILSPLFVRNGLGWWLETPLDVRHRIVAAVQALPIAAEVQTQRGTVGLVHADVPKGVDWPSFCRALEAGDEESAQVATWSRRRVQEGDASGVAGVGRVFVGHTPQKGVQRLGNVYYIDTGAVFGVCGGRQGAGLTMTNLIMSTGMLSNAAPAENLLNTLDQDDLPATPFHGVHAGAT